MFHIACKKCHAWTVVSDLSDPDSALKCGCCPQDHHHGLAANACPGAGANHQGVPCHVENTGLACIAITPAGQPCSGGHCGPNAPGCTVCRPIIITPMPGSVSVGPA